MKNKPEMKSRREKRQDGDGNTMDTFLHQLFLEQLADMSNAEQQLIKALPKMAKTAQSDELREAFEAHLAETENHADRLEEVALKLGETLKNEKCKAMKGLVAEAEELAGDYEDTPSIDAALIAAAQKVEHYEIATYGTLCAWAEKMGHTEAVSILKKTLEEEKAADEKLSEIAENLANSSAQEQEAGTAREM